MKMRLIILLCLFATLTVSVAAQGETQPNPYQVRSSLLENATDYIGVCSPEQAALVWATGVQSRNAAIQYSVMTKKLKTDYAEQLETTTYQGNWVTGMSSPWVDTFEISDRTVSIPGEIKIAVVFNTISSAGLDGKYQALLTIIKEDSFWRIKSLQMDTGLYAYTGFRV